MAKINSVKNNTYENGYDKVFGRGHILSKLVRDVHATAIRAGTELEVQVVDACPSDYLVDDLQEFINNLNNCPEGTYLCHNKAKHYKSYFKGYSPDYLLFEVSTSRVICTILELKSGCNFDTKKVAGEQKCVQNCKRQLKKHLPAGIFVTYGLCSFDNEDKNIIYAGCKNKIGKRHLMTGRQLCQMLNIDYDSVCMKRDLDCSANVAEFARQLATVPEVRNEVLKLIA